MHVPLEDQSAKCQSRDLSGVYESKGLHVFSLNHHSKEGMPPLETSVYLLSGDVCEKYWGRVLPSKLGPKPTVRCM